MIAAVADGAGSASLGDVGAELAASKAVEALHQFGLESRIDIDDDAIGQSLKDAMEAARAALVTEAESREVDQRELASTLILLVATKDGIAAAQVGDGASVVGDCQGNVVGVTQP